MEEIEFNRGKYDPYIQPESDQRKVSQVKKQVNTIGNELDELIEDLRDKEHEVKDLVKRVKNWNQELATPEFVDFVNQVAVQQEQSVSQNIDEVEELHKAQKGLLTSEPVSQANLPKYDQIVNLLNEGRSIEEIARTLNMGYREVELVVKLKQKGARNGA